MRGHGCGCCCVQWERGETQKKGQMMESIRRAVSGTDKRVREGRTAQLISKSDTEKGSKERRWGEEAQERRGSKSGSQRTGYSQKPAQPEFLGSHAFSPPTSGCPGLLKRVWRLFVPLRYGDEPFLLRHEPSRLYATPHLGVSIRLRLRMHLLSPSSRLAGPVTVFSFGWLGH